MLAPFDVYAKIRRGNTYGEGRVFRERESRAMLHIALMRRAVCRR